MGDIGFQSWTRQGGTVSDCGATSVSLDGRWTMQPFSDCGQKQETFHLEEGETEKMMDESGHLMRTM